MEGFENMGNAIPVEWLAVAGVVVGVVAAARKFLRTTFKGFSMFRGEIAALGIGLASFGLIGRSIGAANEHRDYRCDSCYAQHESSPANEISIGPRGRDIGMGISAGIGGVVASICLACMADTVRQKGPKN